MGAAYITTNKVEGGWQYYCGKLCIAKARWVRRGGAWKLQLYHLVPSEGNFGITVASPVIVLDDQAAVWQYLQDLTTNELHNG